MLQADSEIFPDDRKRIAVAVVGIKSCPCGTMSRTSDEDRAGTFRKGTGGLKNRCRSAASDIDHGQAKLTDRRDRSDENVGR